MRRFALALFALITLAGSSATALADPNPADSEAAKQAVAGQIEAFKRDDAAGAYSFAAPGIKAMFPSPDIFLNMVRQAYPQVYRPQSVVYGAFVDGIAGGIAEKVYLTDAAGNGWIALYSFQKQPDGSWKISGCQILRDTSPTI